ncbi:MAG: RNA 3'-terminal phosphate cyclase [Candidatus Nanohaloarchaea archaeon]
MIEIDGSSGGGQMLRTALSLSAVTGQPFRMEKIRGSRPEPGLKRQHLECVRAAARIADAEVRGDSKGSGEIEFRPSGLDSTGFTANIGTAGSTTLLLDTVLPVTTQFSGGFRLTAKGGTDVKWSPTVEWHRRVKMGVLRRHGFSGSLELERTGFYPAGGGEVTLETSEFSMDRIELVERGQLERFEIYSKASTDLRDSNVADRQADEAARMLKNDHVSTELDKEVEYVETDSPGSSLMVRAVYRDSVAGFDALGEKGKRSEEVAREAVEDFRSFHGSGAAVDPFLADQLMVFAAVVGGEYSAPEMTPHMQTNLEVIRVFDRELDVQHREDSVVVRN